MTHNYDNNRLVIVIIIGCSASDNAIWQCKIHFCQNKHCNSKNEPTKIRINKLLEGEKTNQSLNTSVITKCAMDLDPGQ